MNFKVVLEWFSLCWNVQFLSSKRTGVSKLDEGAWRDREMGVTIIECHSVILLFAEYPSPFVKNFMVLDIVTHIFNFFLYEDFK